MKILRKFYYKHFKRYKILQRKLTTYYVANEIIKQNENCLIESEKWVLDTDLEDYNVNIGMVYLCRRERIWE